MDARVVIAIYGKQIASRIFAAAITSSLAANEPYLFESATVFPACRVVRSFQPQTPHAAEETTSPPWDACRRQLLAAVMYLRTSAKLHFSRNTSQIVSPLLSISNGHDFRPVPSID